MLKEIIENLKELELDCEIYGFKRKAKVLQLDLQTEKVLVKLDAPVKTTERIVIPVIFANSPEEYTFEEVKSGKWDNLIKQTIKSKYYECKRILFRKNRMGRYRFCRRI